MAPPERRKDQAGRPAPASQHDGGEAGAADRAEREVRRYLRGWIPWATVYALGFAALWASGLAGTQAFTVWAIGWVLVWGAWVHADHVRRYLRPGRHHRRDGEDEPGA